MSHMFLAWAALLVPLGAAGETGAEGCRGRCGCRGGDPPKATSDAKPAAEIQPGMGMTDEEHGHVFDLLASHDAIQRVVEEIPGGVRTTTTSTRPELVGTLRAHVRQMKRHVEENRPVRMWDPVFREVFAHSAAIRLELREVEGGIEVTETSEEADAAAAIRAHATKVNSFVSRGHEAARPPWAGRGVEGAEGEHRERHP